MRPKVILKTAVSLDGFMDDALSDRRIFSSSLDAKNVDLLRSEVDAILIGANTLREDLALIHI